MIVGLKWPVNKQIGSGAVTAMGLAVFVTVVLALEQFVGWDATWRALGVTPLQPPFFDMHVINDYAICAATGADPYVPKACSRANFNIPPTWLLVGRLGIDSRDSGWMSAVLIGAAATVMIALFIGRPWWNGLVALSALVSPSVLMGVERGNMDLLVLALVGTSALVYEEQRIARLAVSCGLLSIGIALKLIPIFCLSLVARFSKRAFIVACALFAAGCVFIVATFQYVILIHRNVPTTFVLSYGYKALFLGLDHLRGQDGLGSWQLANTWLPLVIAAVVLIGAVIVAARNVTTRHELCSIDRSIAGTAFLFGAGIYCGTYLLGTNFVYRLMFLLLCIPQLLDWLPQTDKDARPAESALLVIVLGVLWVNGSPNGHSTFLLLPQVLNWILFFFLATILISNFLRDIRASRATATIVPSGRS